MVGMATANRNEEALLEPLPQIKSYADLKIISFYLSESDSVTSILRERTLKVRMSDSWGLQR